MSDVTVKKITIKKEDNTSKTYELGAEALNIDVFYDNSNGEIIEDINASGAVIADIQSMAETIKEIENGLSNKISKSDLNTKADLINGKIKSDQIPSNVINVVEGYYNEVDNKFYKDQLFSEEITGEGNKLYIDKSSHFIYRWDNEFIKIVENVSGLDIYDLSDVDIENPQDGESLIYNGNTGKWSNKGSEIHVVTIPTVSGTDTFTYNGSAQGPTIIEPDFDFDIYVTTTGNITAVNAGNYTITYNLKNSSLATWSDGSTSEKTITYTINKANGSIVLASDEVTLSDDLKVATVNVISTTGTVSATSLNEDIATVTATDSAVTITATEENGTTTITVTAAESANYKSTTASIVVTTDFLVIKSFSLATDADLKIMLAAYYADKISLDDMGWHVGDTRVMHFNEMNAPSLQAAGSKWKAQDITIEIVAMEHTDLAEPINGHNKACITVQTREVMNNNASGYNQNGHIYINGDSSYDTTFTKWSNLYMRTFLNSTVLGAIPEGDFKLSIKQSKHYRHTNYNTADDELVTDTLFLPSYPEIFGTASYSYYVPTTHTEGTQFEWYVTQANRVKQGNNNGNKNGTNQYWWEGSASSRYTSSAGYRWCYVNTSGDADYDSGDIARGLAPAFAM